MKREKDNQIILAKRRTWLISFSFGQLSFPLLSTTSTPLMRDYFEIFSIISVSALSAENDMNEIDARINRRNNEHFSFGTF